MSRGPEGGGRPARLRASQRSTLSSVLQYLESRPTAHAPRTPRTHGLRVQPPKSLLSSLPNHGPLSMLGKRSYHHHSRIEAAERRGSVGCQDNSSHVAGSILHNGRSGSNTPRNVETMLHKRRPNWIEAPDDSFFLVSQETRTIRRLLSRSQLRRACRQPREQIDVRTTPHGPAHGHLQDLRARDPIIIQD